MTEMNKNNLIISSELTERFQIKKNVTSNFINLMLPTEWLSGERVVIFRFNKTDKVCELRFIDGIPKHITYGTERREQ